MRDDDVDSLRQPYPANDPRSPEDAWADGVGVRLPNLRSLHAEVDRDLDEKTFGIAWWKDHLDTPRRILIADYLHQAIRSVQINLVEARIHQLELDDAVDKAAALSRIIYDDRRGPRLAHRPAKSAADALPIPLVDLHAAGVFRAIGSTLDCVASTYIGCTGQPLSIMKGDYAKLRDKLIKLGSDNTPSLLSDLAAKWLRLESADTHAKWIDWTLCMRNMLVHRARRLLHVDIRPQQPIWLTPSVASSTVRLVHMLPSNPQVSEVDAFREPGITPVLTEDVRTTATGAIRATIALVESGAELLRDTWRRRRNEPSLVRQPIEQWPHVLNPPDLLFRGFIPDSEPYNAAAYFADPNTVRRMKAAALTDDLRHLWTQWVPGAS